MNLMYVNRRSLALFVAAILLVAFVGNTQAQSAGDLQYFPETGHNVRGEFLNFYNSAPNPLLVFGYPITEELQSLDGNWVQYFQRARFEFHAELPAGQRIQLTSLGTVLYQGGSPQLNIENSAACEFFPSTGYLVCFAFLDFYRANGGAAQFGNPISPFEFHENLIVQYFEKARFEWRADRPEGQRIVLTDLGRIYFDQLGEDQAFLRPIDPLNATIGNILSLRARAFVLKAITLSAGEQTVYVVVQSQTGQGVASANGKATIHFTDGHSEDYFFTTNAAGLGSFTFDFLNQKQAELVPIDVVVTFEGLATTTTTSFRIWY